MAERVSFAVARAADYPDQRYGLICFFDTLHDLGDPVAAARHAAEVLAPGGTVMLVEPFANDRVEDNLSPVGQLYYAGLVARSAARTPSPKAASSCSARRPGRRAWRRCSARPDSRTSGAPPRRRST